MIRSLLVLVLMVAAFVANSQSVKLKINNITDAAGEEVIAFQLSDTTASSATSGGGGSTPVPRFELAKLKKSVGTSTTELFRRSIAATKLAEVTVEFLDATNTIYYRIVLKDVGVGHFSYLSPECAGCAKLFHQIWFDYRQIEWTDVTTNTTFRYNLNTRNFY